MWDLDVIEKKLYSSFEHQIEGILNRISEKTVAVWGASIRGMMAGIILEEKGRERFEFIDSDAEKQGRYLAGHKIVPFHPEDKSVVVLLSMENQTAVKQILLEKGWQEESDFFCLVSSDVEDLVLQMKSLFQYSSLVLGASCLHVIPIQERHENDLAELLQKKCGNHMKSLGLTCMGMKMMYYLFMIEVRKNRCLSDLTVIVSWETLTTFHHILPRVQKPLLFEQLAEYTGELKERELQEQILVEYDIAKERAKNYALEKEYSISILEDNKEERVLAAIKQYLDKGLLEPFDRDCEEVRYLIEILGYAKKRGIKATVIIEPIDREVCRRIYGEGFDERYDEKCRMLENVSKNGGAHNIINASDLLCGEEIITKHTANEALKLTGREKIAQLIAANSCNI